MKKYLSKLIWKPVFVGALAAAVISFLIFPLPYAVAAILIIGLCCGGYFYVNRYCQKLFKRSGPTSYFQDLTQRNMDAIVVGSSVAWKCADCKGKAYYDATGFRRGSDMNFNMLRTYFSHVRTNGTVFYVVDPVESQQIGDYISPNDFSHIHPHVFLKLGVSYDVVAQTNPLVFDRGYTLRFLFAYLQKKANGGRKWKAPEKADALSADHVGRMQKKRAATLMQPRKEYVIGRVPT